MPVSNSSIIHFTAEKAALIGILTQGFMVKYCIERFEGKTSSTSQSFGIPMLSFCDLPLSQVKDHTEKYGSYGIGMKRDWAIRHQVSPVQYLEWGSQHAQSLRLLVNSVLPTGDFNWLETTTIQRAAFEIIRHMKHYESDLTRGSVTILNYRFYDEREWRYVPAFDVNFPMFLHPEQFADPDEKRRYDDMLSHIRIPFEPSEIKYLILKEETEIYEFIELIRSHFRSKATSEIEIDKLITRIITKEQIDKDF